MAIEDLHIDQDSLELCLRLSIGRMAANIHDTLIPAWRAMALAGQDPRPGMARAARGLLGLLLQAYTALQESGLPANRAIVKGMTRAELEAEILQRRDYLRAFRDAPKGNLAQARAAVEALATAFPARRARSNQEWFLDRETPTDW